MTLAALESSPAGPELSVIVITRDEERTIGPCLESIFAATSGRTAEVIVVDSASTDRTVEVAARHPVRIVSIERGEPRRPAIARHLGFAASRGRMVLFVDGDCILDPAWLGPALTALEFEPDLAGVAGASEAILDGATTVRDQYPDADYDAPTHLSGSALYRRAALEAAGDFNPSMRGAEEAELGARLRRAGYRLQRLRRRMTRHFPKAEKETVRELLRRTRRRYPVGMGQLARHAIMGGLPAPGALAAISRHLAFFALLLLGLASGVAAVVAHSPAPVVVWLVAMAIVFTLFVLRAGELRRPAYYFLEWTVTSPLVVWGLLARPECVDRARRVPGRSA